jgi:hypothetical protein
MNLLENANHNVAQNGAGHPTAGSTVLLQTNTVARMDPIRSIDNTGAHGSLDFEESILAQGGGARSVLYTAILPASFSTTCCRWKWTRWPRAATSHKAIRRSSTSRAANRLMPNSLAIDVAPPVVGDDRDLDNRPHDQDTPSVPDQDGVRDLGAYERQRRYCGAADTVYCDNFDFD